MMYAYRDPARVRKVPARITPEPRPVPPRSRRVRPPKPGPSPTPEPLAPMPTTVWGGRIGLHMAAQESAALVARTEDMIRAGHDTPWTREYKRGRNIK